MKGEGLTFLKTHPAARWLGIALIAAALIALPFALASVGTTWVRIMNLAILFALLSLGLNIVVGYAGLLDLGYIAFYGVGAYTYALLASPQFDLHLPFWVILPIGALVACIFGVLLGAPTLKLRGDYLAIVTLGFGEIVRIFFNNQAACVIIKHANPCGVAVAASALDAYRLALATDPTSAFGGIIAFNRELDAAAAEAVCGQFVEVLLAPKVSAAAKEVLAKKENVRVLEVHLPSPSGRGNEGEGGVTPAAWNRMEYKRVGGGLLVQTPDSFNVGAAQLKVVTRVKPTPQQQDDLLFAWRVAKYVKSNAVVFAGSGRTLGVGAGQMSRVDSARIAAIKAGNAGLSLTGSVAASDAFFPFRDGLDVVADAGAVAVIQPGGSLRDEEVIAAADERGIAMVFTGYRHFRH